jgi:multicomponent Na+:H+ antiporter subunit C
MTVVLAVCVTVTFAVSIYLMLDRELKSIAMGVFLLGHAANLSILAMSGSPVAKDLPTGMKRPPILEEGVALASYVDPLPQALILTAIVIGFGVMGFLLTLMVVIGRKTNTLNVDDLAKEDGQESQETSNALTAPEPDKAS